MSEMVERAVIAWLRDLGSETKLNEKAPYTRLISVQLSSADLLGSMRAAIEAIREPTDAMLDRGYDQSGPIDGAIAYGVVEGIWRAMIDEILKP